jgi:hypothetical protein
MFTRRDRRNCGGKLDNEAIANLKVLATTLPGANRCEYNVAASSVDLEMKHVGNLETGSVIEHEVPANHYMHVVRRRWRKHHLQLVRTRLHPPPNLDRQRSIHN